MKKDFIPTVVTVTPPDALLVPTRQFLGVKVLFMFGADTNISKKPTIAMI